MSSGSSSFFQFVALTALVTVGAVYAIKHRDEVGKITAMALERTMSHGQPQASERVSEHHDSSDELEIAANDAGHFETEVEINGSRVEVMVDTGATLVALTYDDAQRAGLYLRPSDFTHEVRTANGVARVAPVELGSITVGDITVRNVRGAVAEQGKLHKTLLGMTFLSRLSRVEMRPHALVLHE
ncbi:MAG: TIGR02281 family clan AA aspartic protease [Hyphomicrobiaceae bacterium]